MLAEQPHYTTEYINHTGLGRTASKDSLAWKEFLSYFKQANRLFGKGETVTARQYRNFIKRSAAPAMQTNGKLEQGALVIRDDQGKMIGYVSIEFYENPDIKSNYPAIVNIDYAAIGTPDGNGNFQRNNPGAFRAISEAAKKLSWSWGEKILAERGQKITQDHDVLIFGEVEDPRSMTREQWSEAVANHIDPCTRDVAFDRALNARTVDARWVQQIERPDGTLGKPVKNLRWKVASARSRETVHTFPSALLRTLMHSMHPVSLALGKQWTENPTYVDLDREWAAKEHMTTYDDSKEILTLRSQMRAANNEIGNSPVQKSKAANKRKASAPLKVVLINGSLHGDSDNSNSLQLLKRAEAELLRRGAEVVLISPELVKFNLPSLGVEQSMYVLNHEKVMAELEKADGGIIATGAHWGQTSSTLQKFIEDATPTECGKAWLGQPMGFIVSEHSTGGQAVLSNLMLTFSNYGCTIPPQAGMVFSRAGQAAKATHKDWAEDVWGPDDIKAIVGNVLKFAAIKKGVKLTPWPVDDDPASFHSRWVPKARAPRAQQGKIATCG